MVSKEGIVAYGHQQDGVVHRDQLGLYMGVSDSRYHPHAQVAFLAWYL